MKVLYATSEAYPFAVSGGLGEVAYALPKQLKKDRVNIKVIMPLYSAIAEEYKSKMKFLTNFYVTLSWRNCYCGIFSLRLDGVEFLFVDNEYYFKRDGIYGHFDDAERYAFFSKAVLETILHLNFMPDIIHCNDWQTALIPVFYRLFYSHVQGFENFKTLLTIHNIQYQGTYGKFISGDVLGVGEQDESILEYNNDINFMKGGIECANRINTVSPNYATEILDPWFSYGLDFVLRQNVWKLSGIINGIDQDTYNPQTAAYYPFSAEKPNNKRKNKKALLEDFGLEDDGQPVLSFVSRLVSQKGIDLICAVMDELLDAYNFKFLVLGTGDKYYENYFRGLEQRHFDKVRVKIEFSGDLSKKMYAGSDLFLMPSKFEPCGIAQMIAMRYGTLPIVRKTGGLSDTVVDCGDESGYGFTFETYNAHDMKDAVIRAINLYYNDSNRWQEAVKTALSKDFSWKKSSLSYRKLYKEMLI